MRKFISILVVVILLSSCQTGSRGLNELDGTYTWRTQFASAKLDIDGRNFFLTEVHASGSLEYVGKIIFKTESIILMHANFPVGGRRFIFVRDGRDEYLLDENRYRSFIKEGVGGYDYSQEFKKRGKDH